MDDDIAADICGKIATLNKVLHQHVEEMVRIANSLKDINDSLKSIDAALSDLNAIDERLVTIAKHITPPV